MADSCRRPPRTEFDSLKSVEISERVNCVRWLPSRRGGTSLLTCNDKTVKLWKVSEGSRTATTYKSPSQRLGGLSLRGGGGGAVRAKMRRSYRNAHNYTINSISCCRCATFWPVRHRLAHRHTQRPPCDRDRPTPRPTHSCRATTTALQRRRELPVV